MGYLKPINAPCCLLLLLAIIPWQAVFAARFFVQFNVPQGPLSEALLVYSKQAEVSLFVPQGLVHNLEAPLLQGYFTTRQALDRLLADTGLGYRFVSPDTVSVFRLDPPQAAIESAADNTGHTEVPAIEEVIVTSGRIKKNLQRLPLAVSVINEDTLTRGDIDSLEGVSLIAPGLTVASFSLGQPTIHMRGIGSNDDGAAMDNSVAVFLDDIYIGRISTIDLNLMDIGQIEVLRGPQAALYGKNVIGGAIRLMSNDPSEATELRLAATAGNYRFKGVNLLASGSLNAQWFARLAVDVKQRDGWQQNIVQDNASQHGYERDAARAKINYRNGDGLQATWAFDWSRDDFESTGRIPVVGRNPITVLDAEGNRITLLNEQGLPLLGADGQPEYLRQLPTDIFRELGGSPLRATNGIEGYTDRNLWGFSQHVTVGGGEQSFVSITGYRSADFAWLEDSVGLPSTLTDQVVASQVDEHHQQISQEFRWTNNPAMGADCDAVEEHERWSYLLGTYLLYEKTHRKEWFWLLNSKGLTDQNNRTGSVSLYGQLGYCLTSKLAVNLGGRYNYDHKRLSQTSVPGTRLSIVQEAFRLNSQASWSDFSPSLSLSYTLNPYHFMYASVTKGMKSGGFQGAPPTLEIARRTIEPESAWGYELGLKSRWLDEQLQTNLVAFYTDYQDLQVVQFKSTDNVGFFFTSNAASSSVYGVEMEVMAKLNRRLSLSGSWAMLDARYDTFQDVDGRDFTGNRLRQAPRDSLAMSLLYDRNTPAFNMAVQLDYRFQSKSYREPDNRIAIQPAFSVADIQLALSPVVAQHWSVSFWVRNLFDKEYISHLYVLGNNDYALFGDPRTYGVTVDITLQ